MSACITGCMIRGQHETTCEDRDTCAGCLPRPAEFGHLCAWDWQRLNGDVVDCPGLVEHLREIGEPDAHAAPPSDTTSYRDPSEGSILPAAWLAADEVHANLASWALLILEEHPNGQGMAGPDEVGAWHTRYGSTVGVLTSRATEALVKWLLPLLPWCAEQEWAGEMRQELATLVATTKARWPIADTRSRHIPGTSCPRCQHLTLWYTPPVGFGLPFVVACENPECGRVFEEDEWTRLVALLERAGRRA